MIHIYIPPGSIPEKTYACNVVFGDFLGLHYQIEVHEKPNYVIVLENKHRVIINDDFFERFVNDRDYLNKDNIPQEISKLKNHFCCENDVIIIYGNSKVEVHETSIFCGVDIIANIFFMLSRWEEWVTDKLDGHKRFPAEESLAWKYDFLDRPIVNEYIEMLWNMLLHLGIKQQRKKHQFTIRVSHDVDRPFHYKKFQWLQLIKDIVKRIRGHWPYPLWNICKQFILVNIGKQDTHDPYYTFNQIMDISDQYNLKSTFYFIAKHRSAYDDRYPVDHPAMITLMQNISARGHQIGLHGSYLSYNNEEYLKDEYNALLNLLKREIHYNKEIGIRQHYLRYSVKVTPSLQADCELKYDTTVGYAQRAGFRSGVCHDYPIFDINKRQSLGMIERPLHIMDGSLLATQYQNLTYDEALKYALMIKGKVKQYNGNLQLLWHNTYFMNQFDVDLYKSILSG